MSTLSSMDLIVEYTWTTWNLIVVLVKDGQLLVVTVIYNFHCVAVDGDDATQT